MSSARGFIAATAASLTGLCLVVTAVSAQVPGSLAASGDQALARISATGVQIYECRSGSEGALTWRFKEPRAELSLAGRPIGRHYAGPTWEHADGSRIVGRVVASAPAPQPGDIPWLRLAVVSHAGEGVLSPVTAVQRVDTRGGTLVGGCDAVGSLTEVPYTAEYVMLRAAP